MNILQEHLREKKVLRVKIMKLVILHKFASF